MRENFKHVVILGGGFAGISVASELGRLTQRNPLVQVHLVNNENYFVFQPLLPEVVACGIEPSHILNPIRQLCPNVQFHNGTITGIDLAARHITFMGSDARRMHTLPYDHVVIGLGLTLNTASIPGIAEHALPLKTMGDAFHLRNEIIRRLEEADTEPDEERRKAMLTFVTIGGGFSGVETMAAIHDMVKAVQAYYPNVRHTGWRMVLIQSTDRILQELDEGLAAFAQNKLEAQGIDIRLKTRVEEITANGVRLSTHEHIPAGTVVCTVGNAPHPLIRELALPQERGRIVVEPTLHVKGMDHVWAIGDAALVPDSRRGGYCPPTAQYAMRQGKQCARNILAATENRPLRTFQFGGFGQMAIVGRRSGVAQVFGMKISGVVAWLLWRGVYLMKLPGLRCKVRVGLDWLLELILPRDIAKMDVQRTEQLKRAHFQQGEIIIRQGEVGDRFYIVESGTVEIVHRNADDTEEQLAIRTVGESFGELALLRDAPRAATVRALTPVDVVLINRTDFLTLAGTYNLFRTSIEQEVTKVAASLGQP